MGVLAAALLLALALALPCSAQWVVEESLQLRGGESFSLGKTTDYALCTVSEMRTTGFGRCAISINTGSWVISADPYLDAFLRCRAVCVRNATRATYALSEPLYPGDPAPVPLGQLRNGTALCALSAVYFGTDTAGQIGGACEVALVGGDGGGVPEPSQWWLSYAQNGSYVQCGAACLVPLEPPRVSEWVITPDDLSSDDNASEEVAVGPTDAVGFCVLGLVQFRGDANDTAVCAVYRRDNVWYLYGAGRVTCRAFCMDNAF